jgi:colanic acid biosynthesis glycosyl transferase WcaI
MQTTLAQSNQIPTDAPMNFLFLTLYFPPEIGAAPTRLAAMTRELANLGHNVEVVTGMPNYPQGKLFPGYRGSFYRMEMRGRVVIHRVWLYPTVGRGLGRLLNYLSFSLTSLYALFRAKKPDYLFVESPPLTLSGPGYIYSLLRRVPLILNIADLWPDTLVEMGLLKKGAALNLLYALERWAYRKASFVNAVTEGLRDSLLNNKHVPQEKLLFLPNGVDTELHHPRVPDEAFKESLGLTGKKVLLYSGTLGRAHALENVMEAANLLKNQPDIHFLFLGDGSERPAMEEMKRRLQLDNVTFHDLVPIEQLAPFQAMADAGLVSIRNIPIFEGARPSKMFPLMAAGKPLLFCGRGEGANLVKEANSGIVVPSGNPRALADALSALLRNPAFQQELGANGRKFVEEHYEWRKLVGKWVGTLQSADNRAPHFRNAADQKAFQQQPEIY